jgi:hypothetical protein
MVVGPIVRLVGGICGLVFDGCFLDVVDDDQFHRALLLLQFEPEL